MASSDEGGITIIGWYTISDLGQGVHRISEPLGALEPRVGVSTANSYLVAGSESAALIDSGLGIGDIRVVVCDLTSLPCQVLNTHYHWDHIGGNHLFAGSAIHELEAHLVAKEQDIRHYRKRARSAAVQGILPPGFDASTYRSIPKAATRILRDNDQIDLGGRVLRVLHIPGHSPGHVAFLDEAHGLLFTGDGAYWGPMYACFPGSDPEAFAQSIRRMAALSQVMAVYPGHDRIITGRGWLHELAENVEAAVTGKVPGQSRRGFITGTEYRFGPVSVWLPK